jgi:hypothetical protein
MIIIIIFLLLTIIEFIIIAMKWNEISDVHTIGKITSQVIGFEEKYNSIVLRIVKFLHSIKPFLWVVTIIILFVNLLAAFALSTIYYLIKFFI